VGVEPTERRFPDVPLALKARRVTGPYSLPQAIIDQPEAERLARSKKIACGDALFHNHKDSTTIEGFSRSKGSAGSVRNIKKRTRVARMVRSGPTTS
jgi:hypothetical protein